MENIYVNSSNFEDAEILIDCKDFKIALDLPKDVYATAHPNLYGYFQFDNFRLNILLGRIQEFKCPWCNYEPEVHYKKSDNSFLELNEYLFVIECPHCKSRGPETRILLKDEKCINFRLKDEECINFGIKLAIEKYIEMIPWDYKLNK